MPNGGNLPKLIKYNNKIKDVTISKFAGVDAGKFGDCYFIKFTEIEEKESEQRKFLWIKKKVVDYSEVERIVPFTFRSLDIAKDFAQFLPNMCISGERLYATWQESRQMTLYETYQLNIESIDVNVFVKFIDGCEHHTRCNRKKKSDEGEYNEFYINDLDKKFFNGEQGNWYSYEELIVEGFFTSYKMTYDRYCLENSKIVPSKLFETLGDIKQIESENTHKFVLMEDTK